MLSMAVISSSASAVSYYEKDDYYAGEDSGSGGDGAGGSGDGNGGSGDVQGQWYGKGAEKLGLDGAVDREQFKEVLEGRLPNGVTLGVKKAGERNHTAGWDLTFSAPKSVSLMAQIGGDKEVLKAHQEAVKETVNWIEETTVSTRKAGFFGTAEEKTGNIVTAIFEHETSRNQDPQLHDHVLVMNATEREDGKWRSVHSHPLFVNKMVSGNIYRSQLAMKLQKLGYEIEKTDKDGRFEIKGIDKEVLEAFSTRRQEIEESLKERGLEGAEASAQAALKTRSSKTTVDREALHYGWEQRASALGFDPNEVKDKANDRGPQHRPGTKPDVAHFHNAVARLSEREAVFTQSKLLGWVLAEGMGQITLEGAEKLIGDASKDKNSELYAAELNGQPAWTTSRADSQERRVLDAVSNGKKSVAGFYSRNEVNAFLKLSPLEGAQKQAARMILTTEDQYSAVVGRPGTGKTFLLGEVREALENKGIKSMGMAPNSEAAKQLQADAGIESGTVASHIMKIQKDLASVKDASPDERYLKFEEYRKQVWFVDEASQVDNGDMRKLVSLSSRLGTRLVSVGDPAQLGAIAAGKPFKQMLDSGIASTELNEIRRQTKAHHLDAVRAGIKGDVAKALSSLAGSITEQPDKDARRDAMVERWKGSSDRDNMLVLAPTNSARQELNEKMRNVLRSEGKLPDEKKATQLLPVFSEKVDRKIASTYEIGDSIRFNKELKSLEVGKGEYWTVEKVDPKTNIVTLRNGDQTKEWNPRKVAGGPSSSTQYRPEKTTVAKGEKIVWTRNDYQRKLNNGQQLRVESVTDGVMTVVTESGEKVEVDQREDSGKHWSHNYATTVYKSQGKTAPTVLVEGDSGTRLLSTQKSFLVSISRQKDSLYVYTDNKEAFQKTIEANTGDKTSAHEGMREHRKTSIFDRVANAMESITKKDDRSSDVSAQPDPAKDKSRGR